MTEPAGDGHLDLDTLAEFDAGLVDESAAARMQSHLDRCESCHAELARLRTTRALVSTLPHEPMPAPVAARIDAALAEAADTPATTTVVPLERRRRWRNTPTLAGAAAAAAVVLLVAAIITGRVAHHSDNGTGASSAPLNAGGGANQSAPLKEWRTDTNYTPATLGALVPHLVTATPPAGSTTGLAGGATGTGSTGGTGSAGSTTAGSAQPPTTSAVPSPAAPKSQDSTSAALNYAALAASPSAVLTCARILNGGPAVVPVAVDFARWSGKPAVVLVLPTIGHPESLDVWVVRSVCSTSSFDLYWRRIPRPAR